jgi:hypothetical protein
MALSPATFFGRDLPTCLVVSFQCVVGIVVPFAGRHRSVTASSREYQYNDREFALTSAMASARHLAIQSPCLMTSGTFQGDEGNSIIVRQTQAVACTMI